MTGAPPLISIVTPCLNAAPFIRDAIESVLGTSAAAVEHIVIDGGSTDGTLEILKDYDHLIVVSARDEGPYDAINRGFEMARGEVFAWLNADDFYVPGGLDNVRDIFECFAEIEWLTTAFPTFANNHGRLVAATQSVAYSRYRALHPDPPRGTLLRSVMQQESTFWRRGLWEAAGARLDTRYKYAADFELWLRFWRSARVYAAATPIGCFRWTAGQRSQIHGREYAAEFESALRFHGGGHAGSLRTVGRRLALAARGAPQCVLRYCPFAVAQAVVSFERPQQAWRIETRYCVPV